MKFSTMLLLSLLCLFALPLFAQNMIEGGNMEDESAWEITYYNEDSQPDFQFNFTGDSLSFGRGGSLNILQGETGGQLLLWQPIILTAGETYRATGALTTTDFIAGEGGGTWYQMYISTEMPDEDAADYNPLTDKMFDVGWGWDRPSEFVEGLWEVSNIGTDVPSAPYYTAPGTPGEKVEVFFGIKFGQYYPDYSGLGFELLVDEVYMWNVAYDDGSSSVEFEADPVVPNDLVLEQNYPNPFNPTTNISFTIPETANTTLKVYNTLGAEVAVLVNGQMQAGRHTVTFNVADLPSGIYYYTMQQNNFTATKKCVILK